MEGKITRFVPARLVRHPAARTRPAVKPVLIAALKLLMVTTAFLFGMAGWLMLIARSPVAAE